MTGKVQDALRRIAALERREYYMAPSLAREALAALSRIAEPGEDARELAIAEFRADELDAVMVSVDKWFDDGDPRLKNNPATRAADAREIALKAIDSVAAQVAKARQEDREITHSCDGCLYYPMSSQCRNCLRLSRNDLYRAAIKEAPDEHY